MKKGTTIFLFLLNCFCCGYSIAQQKQYKALFIGNSYTYTNSLPDLVTQLAASTGDQLTTASYTPGGYTLELHASNPAVAGLINQGIWDYVILQEQSQLPSFSIGQVETDVFPFAQQLVTLIQQANPCARPVFYMTWGRKSGDQDICPYLPSVCTYEGMDNLLQQRYAMMAEDNEAVLCPVGKLWRYIRLHYPTIELYQGDGSHPSPEGSYVAACAFYSVLFKKDPSLCTYSSSLETGISGIIRNAAKLVVYDSLDYWNEFYPYAKSGYSYTIDTKEVTFSNDSEHADTYHWDFGDGIVSTEINPVHTYDAEGIYPVKLTSSHCGEADTEEKTIQVGTHTGIESASNEPIFRIYPNPAGEKLFIESTEPITEIQVKNLTGQTVKQLSAYSVQTSLDLQDLESSCYFLTVSSAQKTMHTKFYKK